MQEGRPWSKGWCPYKKRHSHRTKHHVTRETETGGVRLQPREAWSPRSGRKQEGLSISAPRGGAALPTP